jgi:hypothetical protein
MVGVIHNYNREPKVRVHDLSQPTAEQKYGNTERPASKQEYLKLLSQTQEKCKNDSHFCADLEREKRFIKEQ